MLKDNDLQVARDEFEAEVERQVQPRHKAGLVERYGEGLRPRDERDEDERLLQAVSIASDNLAKRIRETTMPIECGVTNRRHVRMLVRDAAEERWRHEVCGSRALIS